MDPLRRSSRRRRSAGRSAAHVIGALVVLVWGLVGGWRLLDIGSDVLFDNLSGWPARFFSLVFREEFEFTELFSFIPTPDVLSPIVYVLAVLVIASALLVLVAPSRTVRFLAVGAVLLQLGLMAGFAVDFFVAAGADSLEFVLPNFVLPVIGAVLLLWPSRSERKPPRRRSRRSPRRACSMLRSNHPRHPGTPPFGGTLMTLIDPDPRHDHQVSAPPSPTGFGGWSRRRCGSRSWSSPPCSSSTPEGQMTARVSVSSDAVPVDIAQAVA